MSDDPSTTRPAVITEDTRIRTNLKTVTAVSGTIIAGTIAAMVMFNTVLGQIATLGGKIDGLSEAQKMTNEVMRQRVNYLYHMTNTYNPFEAAPYGSSPLSPARPPHPDLHPAP